MVFESSHICSMCEFWKTFCDSEHPSVKSTIQGKHSKDSPLLCDPYRNMSHVEDNWAAMNWYQSKLFTHTLGLFSHRDIHHSRSSAMICLWSTSAQLPVLGTTGHGTWGVRSCLKWLTSTELLCLMSDTQAALMNVAMFCPYTPPIP